MLVFRFSGPSRIVPICKRGLSEVFGSWKIIRINLQRVE
ncbi:Uncharacterised protein [Vibrio cholerae]|nr:Uncharacterised protein [Vibrio cholerae]CSI14497.1 Uncharacterised protein [Vibrio cholerae]